MEVRQLKAGWVVDESRWEELNRRGRNYWWVYIEEILDRLGLCADRIPAADLAGRLPELALLVIGDLRVDEIAADLDVWVRSGGVLIACATEGLDGLCGNRLITRVSQPAGEFSVAGELRLSDHLGTRLIHSPAHPDKPLLIVSDVRLLESIDSIPLAGVNGHPAVTARRHGAGWVYYFGFDPAQTFWAIQQGRPVDADHDGDGYLRTGDALVIGPHEPEIAYTDELLFLLQNMIGVRPIPLIHQLPPKGESIPDALLYYGGDDEGSVGIQLPAAEFMASRRLPYHINCMLKDGKFGIGPDDAERLSGLGTEISLHFNFIDGFNHPTGFTQADVEKQTRAFVKHFGRHPVCSNCHWCRWTGWAEPALWLSGQGIKADNSYAHRQLTVLNPVNSIGFAFGTSYPFHFYADHRSANRRIDVLELPIVAYEVGYTAEQVAFPVLEKALSLAAHYQSTMNFFYHPIYIANHETCRAAIDRLLSLIEEWKISVVHSTPDNLARWWQDRSSTVIRDVRLEGETLRFAAETPSPNGFIAKIAFDSRQAPETFLPHRIVEKFDRKWLMVVVPPGETSVEVGSPCENA